jgi:hypothetical protein
MAQIESASVCVHQGLAQRTRKAKGEYQKMKVRTELYILRIPF